MTRGIKKGLAITLAAAMVITLAPVGNADAAKKVKLSKKTASVTVGKTTTIKVKNGKKSAKVTWKSSKKKVAKITKSTSKGNTASAKIKGLKKGTSIITASYKLGKKTTKLTCKVTVKKVSSPTDTTVTTAPVTTTTVAPVVTNSPVVVSASPTPVVTKGPTNTPRPTATPSPVPKNGSVEAKKLALEAEIVVDGKATDLSWVEDAGNPINLLNKAESVRGETAITAADAKVMWSDDAFYVLVEVAKPSAGATDSVNIYFDEDATATGSYEENANAINIKVPVNGNATAVTNGTAYTWEAKAVTNSTGYVVEAKISLKDVTPEVDGSFNFELQLNDGETTINYFDSVTAMVYDEENDLWKLTDYGVKVGEDTSLFGEVVLTPSMAQATTAFYTADGAALRAAAEIAAELDETENELLKSKTMKFVDTSFWKDAYTAHGQESIFFANSNVPDYKGNAEKLTLEAENRDSAQAYIIWDEDYLYVLFDVNDPDIAPASGDHYDTDSVEFFLDEDYDRPTSYVGDEIQVRVDAFDAAFSANDAGTAGYEYVARAREFKYDDTENPEKPTGYQIQYVIPFMSKHKSGDMMGMDLQINDCFTVETETTDDEENPITVYSPDRAGTLTAYDTSNNAYADPSCFGRVKLFDKNAVTGEGEGEGELGYIELPLTKRTAVSSNNKVTANEDGTVTVEFGPADYAGVTFEFEESQDLSEYNYVHVDATLDSEKQNLNFSLVDSELKDEWNGPLPAGIQYGVPTFPFTFDMAAKANSNNANGYSKVLGVTIFTGASAGFDNGKGTITIHSIRAYKSLDDMPK